ncbi:NADH-quinone oxidoreductase subunit C [Neobacillus sp. PS3-40]|uniref:NADH-quinone oxidoreductase subunit C n=1 Tax=Neobacillus sp. PS3-40 TaxID=3070679 RepID=UPI0027E0098B|nr:NADH-quinone oxidoreductase subunit C [Neobacillus sp. PS3-40]WML46233.1 NADH-quinone oxidoreductase subunit C [Neobacillus sp. PS3-40]
MSGEKDLDQLKKEAVAKAKAAALAKKQAMLAGGESKQEEKAAAPEVVKEETPASGDDADLAKKKAVAVAKAKAAAAAKAKAAAGGAEAPAPQGGAETPLGDDDLAKAKAIAVAKAKAAAAAKAKAAGGGEASPAADEKAQAIAAAKAKAVAAAKAKAAASTEGATAEPTEAVKISPNQKYLDKYVKVIEENLGKGILEDYYINSLSRDVPTLIAKPDSYFKIAQFLKYNEQLGFNSLTELHGTDFETYMEVYVHLFSYKTRQYVVLKVKLDRDEPTIESIEPIWNGGNWAECEAYDLLGIKFTGHPDLHRIMLGEDWVGYPLRKDYKPYDVEV